MSAAHSLPLLQRARVASPCSVRWEDMQGDDRKRRCDQCNLDVHNIAGLTEREAEALLRSSFDDDGVPKQRLCAAIFRRPDGTILTADCPVGLAAVRAKTRRAIARAAAAIGLTTLVAWAAARESSRYSFARTQPLTAIADYLRGAPVTPPRPVRMVAGAVAIPRPQPAPPVLNWLDKGAAQ
jgi:hypothetical protein